MRDRTPYYSGDNICQNRGGIQELPDNTGFRVVLRVHGMTKGMFYKGMKTSLITVVIIKN